MRPLTARSLQDGALGRVFEDQRICTTGLTRESKHEVKELVESEGGIFEEDLSASTNFLIGESVGSAKYKAALSWNVPIYNLAWIRACVAAQKLLVLEEEEENEGKEAFVIPPLAGLVICSTGLHEEIRAQLRDIVTQYGGTYDGDFEGGVTTHLVATTARGDKYHAAEEWAIPVVRPEWIEACVERGAFVEENNYLVTKDRVEKGGNPSLCVVESEPSHEEELYGGIDQCLQDTSSWGTYFQYCQVFIIGYTDDVSRKLGILLRSGMATRYSYFNEAITHVVVGGHASPSEIKKVNQALPICHVVSGKWVVATCLAGDIQNEVDYPPRYHSEGSTFLRGGCAGVEMAEPIHTQHSYISQEEEAIEKDDEFAEVNCTMMAETSVSKETPSKSTPVDASSISATKTDALFSGIHFIVVSNHPSKLPYQISRLGGECVEVQSNQIVDASQALNPKDIQYINISCGIMLSNEERESLRKVYSRAKITTELWMVCCIAERRLFSTQLHPLFTDLSYFSRLTSPLPEFRGIVASISMYIGVERIVLSNLIVLLGGKFTKKLSRKNSHLISKDMCGDKYKKALEWKLEVHTGQWLLDIVERGFFLEVKKKSKNLNENDNKENTTQCQGDKNSTDITNHKKQKVIDTFCENGEKTGSWQSVSCHLFAEESAAQNSSSIVGVIDTSATTKDLLSGAAVAHTPSKDKVIFRSFNVNVDCGTSLKSDQKTDLPLTYLNQSTSTIQEKPEETESPGDFTQLENLMQRIDDDMSCTQDRSFENKLGRQSFVNTSSAALMLKGLSTKIENPISQLVKVSKPVTTDSSQQKLTRDHFFSEGSPYDSINDQSQMITYELPPEDSCRLRTASFYDDS